MRRCFELAKQGAGNVAPNPMVGSVIVHNNKIIGEGYHIKYGEAHAEVNAINSVKNKDLLKESTIYVSLEPCSHYGKTPPCSDLIVRKKIPKVVVACIDTFSEVSGKGILHMQKAGCEVEVGILEEESKELNKRFFTFHEKKRPYIILKWAQTADGFIDIQRTESTPIAVNWITGENEKHLVHKWRAEESAIMVATNTAEKDNPSLSTREWSGSSPIRIVLDRKLRLDKKLKVFDNTVRTIIFNEEKTSIEENTEFLAINFSESPKQTIKEIYHQLYIRNIQSVIIEGGSSLHQSVIDANLWDEARVFVGKKTFGKGKKAAELGIKASSLTEFKNSTLFSYHSFPKKVEIT